MAMNLDKLKEFSVSQWVIIFGLAGMAISTVAGGVMGYQIIEGMNVWVFLGCMGLTVVGYIGHLIQSYIRLKTMEIDKDLREDRLQAGLEDRTIYKVKE